MTRVRAISGEELQDRPSGLWPARSALSGRDVTLEPIDPRRHGPDLFSLSHADDKARDLWTYLPYGPFTDAAAFEGWLRGCAATSDPIFFAVRDRQSGQTAGMASYLNVVPENGVIEIGHIWFAPCLQATRQSTEALFLMIRHAVDDLRYRRVEWKCNALNEASRRAALRLGFTFEGIFHQHMIVKGRNRDSAWFSILDREWPEIRANFEAWLSPDNFDRQGRQRRSLSELNRELGSDSN
jgi:RimJ/RimL family protein N-acetyltransferase